MSDARESSATRAGRIASAAATDLAVVAGASMLSYGAWMVYEPAGFIVGGAMLLAAGLIGALRRAT